MITDEELKIRSADFKEVTNKFTLKTTYQEAKNALGNG